EVGAQQVQQHEQAEARQPGGVGLPERPVQVVGQFGGVGQVFLVVVEAAAVHGPHFAVYAQLLGLLALGGVQAQVEHNEIDGFADPGDGGDHVQPAQQQVA